MLTFLRLITFPAHHNSLTHLTLTHSSTPIPPAHQCHTLDLITVPHQQHRPHRQCEQDRLEPDGRPVPEAADQTQAGV